MKIAAKKTEYFLYYSDIKRNSTENSSQNSAINFTILRSKGDSDPNLLVNIISTKVFFFI